MIVKPMIRSNICLNAHPVGCAKETERQIAYVQAQKARRGSEGGTGPRMALVLGCSTGYGLASRITAAFAYGARTLGVSFEKAGTETKSGTPAGYNNAAFDRAAGKAGEGHRGFRPGKLARQTTARKPPAYRSVGTVNAYPYYGI
jgi:enoyl-[acyl-carrier protein] reductase/trans-2-enoyl-CoA reductase (NAD+)